MFFFFFNIENTLIKCVFKVFNVLHLYQNQKGSSLYHIQQKQMPSVNWEERKLGRMNHVAHRRHLLLLNMVQGAAFLVLIEV